MKVVNIWRYPVKTMAGEPMEKAQLRPDGITGDRIIQVRRADDQVITSRSHPAFLGLHGSLSRNSDPLVDGLPWNGPEVAALVEQIGGDGATLVADDSPSRFDVLPLMVVTHGAIASFGQDYRRLRPNIVIGGVEGLRESLWPGVFLKIGDIAVIGVESRRLRCIMTAYDPDTQVRDTGVTRDIYRRFEGRLGLDCFVAAGGEIAVGDTVQFARRCDRPR